MEITELKHRIREILKTHWIESNIETREDRISELEDRTKEFTQFQQKEKTYWKSNPQNLWGLWDNNKRLAFPSSESLERGKRVGLEECIKK